MNSRKQKLKDWTLKQKNHTKDLKNQSTKQHDTELILKKTRNNKEQTKHG